MSMVQFSKMLGSRRLFKIKTTDHPRQIYHSNSSEQCLKQLDEIQRVR